MKVERPRARSSEAPTRLNSRSTTPICADPAGTKEPICARIAISAFWRRKVDYPHIGAGQKPDRTISTVPLRREIAIIGNKRIGRLTPQRLLDDRMTASHDVEGEAVINMWAAIALLFRQYGKRS